VTDSIQHSLYIDGGWIAPTQADEVIEVVNPATEDVVRRLPAASSRDVDAAVEAARRALPAWASTPVSVRARTLLKVAQALRGRRDEIASVITTEMGSPITDSRRVQVMAAVNDLEVTAHIARSFAFQELVDGSLIKRVPMGVVAAIAPWNYPLHQIAAKVGPALAAGCTVVLKPSELAPLDAYLLVEEFERAGLPPGVLNLVVGGSEVGAGLVEHSGVDMVTITGSVGAGVSVAKAAAPGLKRVVAELGGKSAALLAPGADFNRAVASVIDSCFFNAGQTCGALTRLLVPAGMLEQVETLAVDSVRRYRPADPMLDTCRLGPVISDDRVAYVRQVVDQAQASGAEVFGSDDSRLPDRGSFMNPVVVSRAEPTMRVATEELFAPVLTVLGYDDLDDAVSIANSTDFGLSSGVWAGSRSEALEIANRINAGQVNLNGASPSAYVPFGGFARSGLGVEFGRYGLEEFLGYKSIQGVSL